MIMIAATAIVVITKTVTGARRRKKYGTVAVAISTHAKASRGSTATPPTELEPVVMTPMSTMSAPNKTSATPRGTRRAPSPASVRAFVEPPSPPIVRTVTTGRSERIGPGADLVYIHGGTPIELNVPCHDHRRVPLRIRRDCVFGSGDVLMASVTPTDVDRMVDDLFIDGPIGGRKSSKFWTLLALSAVIATAGVVADSTATVIGAMIVAPLMTPILGTALAVVLADRLHLLRSVSLVVGGALVVIALGLVVGLVDAPLDAYAANTQVAGRISPRLIDLLAALATGTVGAFALVRSDISDTLPGVAIAISLVPPLAVVGLLVSVQRYSDAGGALLLFGTNVAAIIATGTAVLIAYRVRDAARDAEHPIGPLRGTTLALIAAMVLVVAIPLGFGTLQVALDEQLAAQAKPLADDWASSNKWVVTTLSATNGEVVITASGSPPTPMPPLCAGRSTTTASRMPAWSCDWSSAAADLPCGRDHLHPLDGLTARWCRDRLVSRSRRGASPRSATSVRSSEYAATRRHHDRHDRDAAVDLEMSAADLDLPPGLEVTWLGVAGVGLAYEGTRLLIDPYVTRLSLADLVRRRVVGPDRARIDRHVARADAILLGHTHFDHALDAAAIARRDRCPVYGGDSAARLMALHGLADQAVTVTAHQVVEIGPFEVTFVPSAHSRLVLGLAVPNGGEITCEHVEGLTPSAYCCGQVWGIHVAVAGRTFYHQGSADLLDDELRHRDVDYFLCGIAGRQVTQDYLTRVLGRLTPRHVLAMHHDDFFRSLDAPAGVRVRCRPCPVPRGSRCRDGPQQRRRPAAHDPSRSSGRPGLLTTSARRAVGGVVNVGRWATRRRARSRSCSPTSRGRHGCGRPRPRRCESAWRVMTSC